MLFEQLWQTGKNIDKLVELRLETGKRLERGGGISGIDNEHKRLVEQLEQLERYKAEGHPYNLDTDIAVKTIEIAELLQLRRQKWRHNTEQLGIRRLLLLLRQQQIEQIEQLEQLAVDTVQQQLDIAVDKQPAPTSTP